MTAFSMNVELNKTFILINRFGFTNSGHIKTFPLGQSMSHQNLKCLNLFCLVCWASLTYLFVKHHCIDFCATTSHQVPSRPGRPCPLASALGTRVWARLCVAEWIAADKGWTNTWSSIHSLFGHLIHADSRLRRTWATWQSSRSIAA